MNRTALFSSLLTLLFSLHLPAQALNLDQVEVKIHSLTNQLRAEKNLPPLKPLEGLYALARKHSEAMASQHFFSHTDPQGRSPFDRMAQFMPGLLSMGSAENIAMRSSRGEDEDTVALGLFTQWKHSPGHYANMIGKGYRHLGVGVAEKNNQIYATQNFATGLVLLQSPLPGKIPVGTSVKLRFEFLADFPPAELSAYLHVPDKNARFYTSSGSFYTGGGPLTPAWIDKQHFVLSIPTDKGVGKYSLGIGQSGAYYDTPFAFETTAGR
ncbi:hypothetical protein COW36_07380 [bacterium (Candidatus Blackallbacteria) CG17_big_fil_post_rev_8_21_14_2_50_48_46]|uniref:SCP domain-containing protein n=1 Tax=bacterium (Candidatus Blackallbacteria) CG17_big_fil_post_rev_8_21_14_2_50_48_46 TaxID=2014261 RepID=A0A2M7G7F3_9BACT|nr:MAG: hypothetical protein COW64_06890 [bacterium (Candidatus Blackallbacteria) CG18_big_fil_WC_8_21_14_2_50_49_26]PIW17881.1 MAG: hypothetical protein COW36_07380 [bacterium (Candidatus Blackallbacteria) CG17_big_fil_post_rev_8_21_14_2_50_48_46]PIW48557.1 MAG: hypothetical protein COW20_09335 [bacterium (Candidatus Blackallbacteria) CG13_big_fil_rev_8_21_14_2_50_49_14]